MHGLNSPARSRLQFSPSLNRWRLQRRTLDEQVTHHRQRQPVPASLSKSVPRKAARHSLKLGIETLFRLCRFCFRGGGRSGRVVGWNQAGASRKKTARSGPYWGGCKVFFPQTERVRKKSL